MTDPFELPDSRPLPVRESNPLQAAAGARYNVLRPLGEGGFGAVYLADDSVLKQKVAIKVLHLASNDERTRSRFIFEAQTAANLRHPGIVNVFDIVETRDGLQQVMEYYPGGTLREKLDYEGAMPPTAALQLTLRILDALGFAHEKGIIHRDIKPANILFAEDGSPKIGDFGLCAQTDSHDHTLTGESMGTPLYMAPEQSKDAKSVDGRADIYSVGLVLYHMLTGERPVVIDLSLVPAPLRPLMSRVTAQDRQKRPASCREFMALIEQALPQLHAESVTREPDFANDPIDLFETATTAVGRPSGASSGARLTSSSIQPRQAVSIAVIAALVTVFAMLLLLGGYFLLAAGGSGQPSSGSAGSAASSPGGTVPEEPGPATPPIEDPSPAAILPAAAPGGERGAAAPDSDPPPVGGVAASASAGAPGASPPASPFDRLAAPAGSGSAPQFPSGPTGGINPPQGLPATSGPAVPRPGSNLQGGFETGLPFHMPTPALQPIGRAMTLLALWIEGENSVADSAGMTQAVQMLQGGNQVDQMNPVFPYLLGRIAEQLEDDAAARSWYGEAAARSSEFMNRPGEYLRDIAGRAGVQVSSPGAQAFFFGQPDRSLR